MLKERGGILGGNHKLAMQAQRERQARRNAANAQAMAQKVSEKGVYLVFSRHLAGDRA
jgi:hypothetical protein